MKTEDVDKICQSIEDSLPVVQDVEEALEDGKIQLLTEGAPLVIKHGGKLLRLIGSAKEIAQEIADMNPNEAEQVMDMIAATYSKGNPKVKEGAKDIVMGVAGIRTGVFKIIEAKKEEKTVSP